MRWEVVRNLNVEIGKSEYLINLADTKFNLVYEIHQPLFGRIFFGIKYWPEISKAFQYILESANDEKKSTQIDVFLSQDKRKKLTLTYENNNIKLARKQADVNGSTWLIEHDSNRSGGLQRSISIFAASKKEFSQLESFVNKINQLQEEIQDGKVKQPEFGGYGLFYPDEMVKSDRSMLSFKELLDDESFECFVRLDENKNNSEKSARIARAKVAKEAKEKGITFLEDKRYDDGFISFDDHELSFDWEIRRDWYGNFNNIAIRYVDKRNAYFAVDYPPPAPGNDKEALSKEYQDMDDLIDFLKKNKFRKDKPYFIYNTLGQFPRKIDKKRIVLSLQCSQMSPLWPKRDTQLGYFVAAWHIDFSNAGTVRRTTQNHAGEMGEFYDCNNFGIFPFNHSGVSRFKENVVKQFKSGVVEDAHSNLVPKKRAWF